MDTFQRLSVSATSAFVGAAAMDSAKLNQSASTGRKFLKNRMYAMTIDILDTYTKCNPSFRVVDKLPQRVLTNPSEGFANNGADNEEANLICRVHDQITCSHTCYTILDLLGTGTFGQVFRCQKDGTKEVVAIKIIKNKAAYHSQGLLEVKIARLLNNTFDPRDERHIVRLLDSFEFNNHICLVFELLSMSLLDILTQNQFRGLPLSVVQRFTRQIIAAMVTLEEANIIHCDLKPENILLAPPKLQKQTPPPTRRKSDDITGRVGGEGQDVQKKEVTGGNSGGRIGAETGHAISGSSSTPPPSLVLSASADDLDPLIVSKEKEVIDSSPAIVTPEVPHNISQDREKEKDKSEKSEISEKSEKDKVEKVADGVAASSSRGSEHQSAQGGRLSVWSDVKVIDLGSACFEGRTMYSYIQSRFYRSPEVLLGVPYNGAIDMWSLACVCAEMYLGLPLFPGVSQHNQLTRIIEMMGYPPDSLIEGKNGSKYFSRMSPNVCNSSSSSINHTQSGSSESSPNDMWNSPTSTMTQKYHLKSAEEYAMETNTEIPVLRKYLRYSKLDDVIMKCPLANKSRMSVEQKKGEMLRRLSFLNFLEGLFKMNPFERWTAKQAANHPFITNAVFTGQFTPVVDPKINERKLAYFVQTQQKDHRARGNSYLQRNTTGSNLDLSSDGMHVFRPLQFRRLSEPLRLSPAGVKEVRSEDERALGPLLQRGQSVREPDSLSSPSQAQMQYQHQSLPYNGSQYLQQQQYLQRFQLQQHQQYAELLQTPPEQYSAYSASTPEGIWASYTVKDQAPNSSSNNQYMDAMAHANSQAALTMSRNASSCDDLSSASMMALKGRNMLTGENYDANSWNHNFANGKDNRAGRFTSTSNQPIQQQHQQHQQNRPYIQNDGSGGSYTRRGNGVLPRQDHRHTETTQSSPQSYQTPSFLQQKIQSHDTSQPHRNQQQQNNPMQQLQQQQLQQLQYTSNQQQNQHQSQHHNTQQYNNYLGSGSNSNMDVNNLNNRLVSGSMDSSSGSGFEGFGGSMTDMPLMMTDFGQALMRPELDERRRLHSMQSTGGQMQYEQQYNMEKQQGQIWLNQNQNQQHSQSFSRQRTAQQSYYPPQQQQQQQQHNLNQQSQSQNQNQNQHMNLNQAYNRNQRQPQQKTSFSQEKYEGKLALELAAREQARSKLQYAASSSDGGNYSAASVMAGRNALGVAGGGRGDDQSDPGRSVSFAVAKSKDNETHNYVAQLVVNNRGSNGPYSSTSSPGRPEGSGDSEGGGRSSSDGTSASRASKGIQGTMKGSNGTASSSTGSKPALGVGDVADVLADWDPFFSGDDFEVEEEADERGTRLTDSTKKVPSTNGSRSESTGISDRGSTDDGDIDPDVDESEWRSAGSRGNSADVNRTPELPYKKR